MRKMFVFTLEKSSLFFFLYFEDFRQKSQSKGETSRNLFFFCILKASLKFVSLDG